MAHGYSGLNYRDIAQEVGIKAPSIYHYFPTKADLGATVTDLDEISNQAPDPFSALHRYAMISARRLQATTACV
jgi:TetR/AcrR family transcriptional repressor of nem operon